MGDITCFYSATKEHVTLSNCDGATSIFDPSWLSVLHWAEIAVAVIVVLLALRGVVRIAKQWERCVILRLGKFSRVAGPGLFFKWPFIEKIADTVSMQLRIERVMAEKTLTKDTVPVNVEAIVRWVVRDPRAAVIDITNFRTSILRAAQIVLRESIGGSPLAELLSDRVKADERLTEAVAHKTEGWGIDIKGVDIQDVQIPDSLQDSLSREAQAERERHARVILGQSEIEIAEKFVAAAKIYESDPVALQLRQMNIIYETTKERGSTILLPSSLVDALGKVMTKPGS